MRGGQKTKVSTFPTPHSNPLPGGGAGGTAIGRSASFNKKKSFPSIRHGDPGPVHIAVLLRLP
jgi:hypothetical protein